MPVPTILYHNGEPVSDTNRIPMDADIVLGDTTIDPTGLATDANQALELTELGDINTELDGIAVDIDTTATQVSAINTKTPALGQALEAASVPVVLPVAQVAALVSETNFSSRVGATDETAPTNDTNAAGLNGLLKRVNQRLSALIALLPAALTAGGNLKTALLEAIPAGDNNIGNVDVVTMPDFRDTWRVSTQSFTTTNDSNVEFTVPANTEWQILFAYLTLATTSTAGNRQLTVEVLSASDVILARIIAGIVQAASTTYQYMFAPGLIQEVAVRDTSYVSVAMPQLVLTAGQKIKFYDKTAVAAAADDMTIQMQIAARSIA